MRPILRIDPSFPATAPAHEAALPEGVQLRDADPALSGDWARIGNYLASQGLALDAGTAPRRFAGGLANLNYLVRLADGDWAVFRRPPPGPLPSGAHDMAREHRILSRLWEQLPAAPRSLHLCTDPSVAGAPFQLLEFRPGVTLRGTALAPYPATAQTGQALSGLLVEGLARIHSVDPRSVGLDDLGRPEGFLARTVRGWSQRAQTVCGVGLSTTALQLADWLARSSEGLGGDGTLLHNDFKLDNLVLDPTRVETVAVLDWDMGTRGDALFDLATLLSYWTEPGDPDCMHRLAQMPTARPGFLTREQAAQAYARRTGRSLAGFKVYRILAMFKLGVVFHQLHTRYRTGQDRDPRYAGFGDLAEDLLRFCQDVANDKTF